MNIMLRRGEFESYDQWRVAIVDRSELVAKGRTKAEAIAKLVEGINSEIESLSSLVKELQNL